MAYRATDGRASRQDDGVAIGLCFMRTLPEDPVAATVFTAGALSLVCDARLDNRAELIEALNLSDPGVSEGEILLAAYRQWGKDCVARLLGDFAFIVHDASERYLFAARDHMGVRPLFYRAEPSRIVISTEMRTLISPGGPFSDLAPIGPAERKITDFLLGQPGQDHTVFFEGICRLPPGHWLGFGSETGFELACYWQPDIASPDRFADTSPAAFRRLFEEAVRCRSRALTPPAYLLSGGLDSTSIACCAATQADPAAPVNTFSIVFDQTPQWSERSYIEAALKQFPFRAKLISLDDHAPLDGFEGKLVQHGRLFNAPGLSLTHGLVKALSADGFRVYIDGHGGDEVVSHGVGRLNELAEAGRWGAVWRESRGCADLYQTSRTKMFVDLFLSHARFKGRYKLGRLLSKWTAFTGGKPAGSLLNARLAANRTAPARNGSEKLSEAEQHVAALRTSILVDSLEIVELMSAGYGTQPAFPFFDKRLVEFCLALPSEAKLAKGYTRLILREALEGILPEKVRWRRTKFDFAPHIARGFLRHHKDLLDEAIVEDRDGAGDYVDIATARASLSQLKKQGAKTDGLHLRVVWSTAALSLWLRVRKKQL